MGWVCSTHQVGGNLRRSGHYRDLGSIDGGIILIGIFKR